MRDNLPHRIEEISLMNTSILKVYAVTIRDFGN